MHHDSMYGMESEHGTLILSYDYQLHLGFSGNTLYNARTMIDRMLLLFPCNTLYKHERWLTGLLDVMDPGADYWCFSNDFPPGCLVFPCNTLYNTRMMFVCFSCNTLYNALTMVDHTPGCYASRVSIIGVSQTSASFP